MLDGPPARLYFRAMDQKTATLALLRKLNLELGLLCA